MAHYGIFLFAMMAPPDHAITLAQGIESLNVELDTEPGFLFKDPEFQRALVTRGENLPKE